MTEEPPDAIAHWQAERTTFQRVYDVVVGTTEPVSAAAVAERADCAAPAARGALQQLVEMGIAERCGEEPATFCRNESYLDWRRVDALAREFDAETLRERADALADRDRRYAQQFGVDRPEELAAEPLESEDVDLPEDVGPESERQAADVGENVTHHDVERQWWSRTTWRSVRRDREVVERAADRAEREDERRGEVDPYP